ncbi:Transposon Ty3-I Gag-Pol polyprotein [Smittium culicis]|uniref:Transposon Ty3-I Gag-Pol polyprotein n=1 Tax=Smittium culicis TaxID=133412 RepID=A0A1R1Y134_9FUNG|nr:Transposon Ty3-I Gag-Pol polyprotein [Smittium culicis]
MPAYNSDSSNPSSPLRTPPIFGADYEEDAAQLIYQLGPRNDHEPTTELVPKVPAQMSTLENTQKCRMKVSSDCKSSNLTLWRSHLGSSSDESDSGNFEPPLPLDTDSYLSSVDSALQSPTILRARQYAEVYAIFDSPSISKHLLDKKSVYVGAGIIQKQTPIDTLTRNLKNLSLNGKDSESGDEFLDPSLMAEDAAEGSSPIKLPATNVSNWIHQAPPIFHGRWDEDVWKFAEQFNKHVSSLTVTLVSDELLNYFREYLEDEALRIVEPLMVLYPEWDTFIVQFTRRFTHPDRKSRAKVEFKKIDMYAEESLFTFAKLVKIFNIMGALDEDTKVVEILKKCNEVDRNRLLDKDVKTVEDIMNFFAKKEEQQRVFNKKAEKHFDVPSHSSDPTNMFIIKRPTPGTNSVLDKKKDNSHKSNKPTVTPSNNTGKNSQRRPFCQNCRRHGHTADACRRSQTETPTHTGPLQKREAFSSLPRARHEPLKTNTPSHKRMDVDSTPYKKDVDRYNQADVNLVSIGMQEIPTSNVAAIKGKLKIHKREVLFQYDSGSSINVISTALVQKLKLKPVETSELLITPVSGISQPSKVIKVVPLDFPTFSCSATFSVIENTRPDLFLLGVDFMVTIGAEISLKKKLMTVELQGKVHHVPLILENRKDYKRAEVATATDIPEFIPVATENKFVNSVNEELKPAQRLATEDLLTEYTDIFAEKLEDLRGADVSPYHRALTTLFSNPPGKGRLGRWVVKLRHYDFTIRHKEGASNPADFLSRFPWEELPEVLEEEVLYISTSDFSQLYQNVKAGLERLSAERPLPGDGGIKNKYEIRQDKLYVKINNILKLYVVPAELKDVIKRIHNEHHKNAQETFRILTENYFAPASFPMVKNVVRSCEQCQRHNYAVRRTEPFHGVQVKYPFQQWGLDVAGPFTPVSSSGNKYIIVAIDYFTKWPVAVATKSVNAAIIIAFLCEQIIANFGVPKLLITDRGTHLSNEACASFNRYLGINHMPVTAYRPQANGQVERTIQTLKQTLRKIVTEKPENWDCYLWRALLAMRTTKNRSLGRSPAEIVYGLKLLTPAVWGSQVVTNKDSIDTIIENRKKFLELELPSYRQLAYDLGVKSKEIEARYYNKKVKSRKIKVGEKVLKALIEANTGLSYKNVGPFIVMKDLNDGTYEIVDDRNNTDRVHADRLIQYQSEWGQVPRVQTGQARSTLPSLLRPLSRF